MPKDATMEMATWAAGLQEGDLPADYRAQQQLYVLDCVATMLAGSVQPVHAAVSEAAGAAMGVGDVEALGGRMTSLSGATLLDGLCAANFEFEHVSKNAHPSSAAFPALLVLAAERGLPGSDFLAATAAAYELAVRIGDACTSSTEQERGFHNPGVNGTLASAGGCARLLNLDPAGCASAMGLAGSSSAGLLAFTGTGAMTKRLHPARSAQLGLECALMAQAGVQGPSTVLEDKNGLLHAFSPAPDPSRLLPGLGRDWKSQSMIMKLAPVHLYAQAYVHALCQARSDGESWDPADVSAIEIDGSSVAPLSGHMDRNPKTLVAAQYSIPFSIAVAVAHDLRDPLQVNDSALTNPQVTRLMRLVTFQSDPRDPDDPQNTVTMTVAGKQISLDASSYPGHAGSAGYAQAVLKKLDQVGSALHVRHLGDGLRRAVEEVSANDGPRKLRRELLAVARNVGDRL